MLDYAYPTPLTLDQRFRLCLPVEAREGLTPGPDGVTSVVIGRLPEEPCLWLMTRERYAAFLQRISARAGDSASGRRLKTLLISNFSRVAMDAQGRLTLPEPLCRSVGIGKTVRLVGHGEERTEIWATEALQKVMQEEGPKALDLLEDIFVAETAAQARNIDGAGPSAGVGEGSGRRG
ncbi:MAG TPA: hypothetical protein VEI02_07540 [Planctomycetota bacterium]|nr:hypothetical protein [Planctomycetota bacterium]